MLPWWVPMPAPFEGFRCWLLTRLSLESLMNCLGCSRSSFSIPYAPTQRFVRKAKIACVVTIVLA
jgi:hypothetical protein